MDFSTSIGSPTPSFVYEDRTLSHGMPARSLAGLPLARVIPQDVHSILDYANALASVVASMVATSTEGCVSSAVLGGSLCAASLMSDYRLAAARLIPIEAHEVLDYAWG